MISPKRLYTNAERTSVTEDPESPDAQFLLVGAGCEIPDADAKRLGLMVDIYAVKPKNRPILDDEMISEAPAVPEAKAPEAPEAKASEAPTAPAAPTPPTDSAKAPEAKAPEAPAAGEVLPPPPPPRGRKAVSETPGGTTVPAASPAVN